MNKKAQAEQFNWIFVILAGSIILAFFMFFAFKYMALQEKREALTTARTIQESVELLKTGELYLDAEQFKLGQQTRIETTCLEQAQKIYINRLAEEEIEDAILFMPKDQTTTAFAAWTNAYKAPFQVTNVIYMAPQNKEIEIIYDEQTREQVEALEIPEVFKSKKRMQATTEDVIYITSTAPANAKRYINLRTNQVRIEGKEIATNNRALALGALFTDDAEDYECLIKKAKEKQKLMVQLYTLKAGYLKTQYPTCLYEELQRTLSRGEQSEKQLEEQNAALLDNSCPLLF